MPVVDVPKHSLRSDPTTVDPTGEAALNLYLLVHQHRPKRILETGTFLGTGTTAILASCVEDECYRPDCDFASIELDPNYCKAARFNLDQNNFDWVRVLHGLSIPKGLLPTPAEIRWRTVDAVQGKPIVADHDEGDRVYQYYAETAWVNDSDTQDDLIGRTLDEWDGRPDLVMLDSGGHIGWTEFEYVVERLNGPCFIALDDIFHVKHNASFSYMLEDRRFDVRCVVKEKYGFCIAQFRP